MNVLGTWTSKGLPRPSWSNSRGDVSIIIIQVWTSYGITVDVYCIDRFFFSILQLRRFRQTCLDRQLKENCEVDQQIYGYVGRKV